MKISIKLFFIYFLLLRGGLVTLSLIKLMLFIFVFFKFFPFMVIFSVMGVYLEVSLIILRL